MHYVKTSILSTALCILISGCMLGTPFKSTTELEELSPDTLVTVGVTHVIVGDDSEKNSQFWNHTTLVINSLPSNSGYLGHKLRRKVLGNEAWTMTVWKDDMSLNSFVKSTVHRTAIKNGMPAVTKARFVRFTTPRSTIPLAWDEIEKIMNEKGRGKY